MQRPVSSSVSRASRASLPSSKLVSLVEEVLRQQGAGEEEAQQLAQPKYHRQHSDRGFSLRDSKTYRLPVWRIFATSTML